MRLVKLIFSTGKPVIVNPEKVVWIEPLTNGVRINFGTTQEECTIDVRGTETEICQAIANRNDFNPDMIDD